MAFRRHRCYAGATFAPEDDRMRATGTRSARRRALIAMLCLSLAGAVGASARGAEAAASADPCTMFTTAQVRSWFGKEAIAKPTRGVPQEQGCQWLPKDGSPGGLAVTIGPADSYSPKPAKFGFTALAGIGDKAYIVPVQGGWEAGALKGGKAVWLRTPNLSKDVAMTVLKAVVAKL
jgi:hypothetical protein